MAYDVANFLLAQVRVLVHISIFQSLANRPVKADMGYPDQQHRVD